MQYLPIRLDCHRGRRVVRHVCALLAAGALAIPAMAGSISVVLAGEQQVPPVPTSATGMAIIAVERDRMVHGTLTTSGIVAAAAHIEEGGVGGSGAIVVALDKNGDLWRIPEDTRLTEAQYHAYVAGNLYITVRSDAYKDGEIRGQVLP
jgi:hypothetical protein